jgi:hypothetical protein
MTITTCDYYPIIVMSYVDFNHYHFLKVQPLLGLHDYKYDYKLQLHN